MPEAFHARFSVSCRSYEVTSRVFGLQPTKLLIAREKKTYPGYISDHSVDETLWWDHFCNNDSTVLLHDSICFKVFKNNLILFAILSWGNVD